MTRVVHIVAAPEFTRLILRYELRMRGDREEHLVICSPGADLDLLEAEGIRVIRHSITRKLSPIADLVSLSGLIRILRRLSPELVHTYTPKAGLIGQMAAAAAGVRRRVHGCRGLLYRPGMARWRRALFELTDRITCLLAHRVLFVSGADLRYLVDRGICSPGKARLTGNGIDLSLFQRNDRFEEERAATRAELGYRADDVVVLTVGRFVADKGYLDLIAAIGRIRRSLDRIRFLWVAPVMGGEEAALLPSLIGGPPLNQMVTRLERRDDMRRVYQAADLLLHPSHREGVPRVLMEAAANGLPILASDIAGNREVVEFGRSAARFDPASPTSLAAALDGMLANRQAWSAMADAGRTDVLGRMDVASVAARVAEVYRELGLTEPPVVGAGAQ
ncbi:MAG: glycosyltransferase [Gemmatimonadales bacterium]